MKSTSLKILSWNVGVFQPLTYLKFFGLRLHNHHIEHEFFYKHNGGFISEYITSHDPDIIILQEVLSIDDTASIPILSYYPYQQLLPMWGDNNILVASKKPFSTEKVGSIFYTVTYDHLTLLPLHLNSFSTEKRRNEILELIKIIENLKNHKQIIALGDTNLWERNKNFLFGKDKVSYQLLTEVIPEASNHIVSTHAFGASIDKVFHHSNIMSSISCDKKSGLFMDHYPVVMEIHH